MGEELGVPIHVAGVKSRKMGIEWGIVLLWTLNVDDGGTLQTKLQNKAADVVKSVEDKINREHVTWMKGDITSFWAMATFHYYGRSASRLPDGNNLAQEIGQ